MHRVLTERLVNLILEQIGVGPQTRDSHISFFRSLLSWILDLKYAENNKANLYIVIQTAVNETTIKKSPT